MAEPPQTWSGPGLILTYVDIQDHPKLTLEALEEWWIVEIGPKLVDTGAIIWSWAYKAAGPNDDKQLVLVYRVSDLAQVHAGALKRILRISEMGYFEGDLEADHLTNYESRIYSFEQLYETSKQQEEPAPTVLIELMEPPLDGEAELDSWYREEHNQRMSQEPGWKRTMRFRLLFQHSIGAKESEKLSFLAFHEFSEANKLGKGVKPLEPVMDRTKQVTSKVKAVDAAIYHKCRVPKK